MENQSEAKALKKNRFSCVHWFEVIKGGKSDEELAITVATQTRDLHHRPAVLYH